MPKAAHAIANVANSAPQASSATLRRGRHAARTLALWKCRCQRAFVQPQVWGFVCTSILAVWRGRPRPSSLKREWTAGTPHLWPLGHEAFWVYESRPPQKIGAMRTHGVAAAPE
eukprot:353867-Chlamydomonas_euryale.AAC.2